MTQYKVRVITMEVNDQVVIGMEIPQDALEEFNPVENQILDLKVDADNGVMTLTKTDLVMSDGFSAD